MITTADFKKGLRIELDGAPWTIVNTHTQTPSARGAATLVKARIKNVLTGQVSDKTFRAGEKFAEPDLHFAASQYLYDAPDDGERVYHFMDSKTYDQFELRTSDLGSAAAYLGEGLEVKAVLYNGTVVGIELPQFVELAVTSVEPGSKGDTASGAVLTTAHTATGVKVQVPLYVKDGDTIRVDTTTGGFKDRV